MKRFDLFSRVTNSRLFGAREPLIGAPESTAPSATVQLTRLLASRLVGSRRSFPSVYFLCVFVTCLSLGWLPTPVAASFVITSPTSGAHVAGTIVVAVSTTLSLQNDWWNQLLVDGRAVATDQGSYQRITWNSSSFPNGKHTLKVVAYQKFTAVVEGQASVGVAVGNGVVLHTAAPSPTSSVAPTAVPTVRPTSAPSIAPTVRPTAIPTAQPTSARLVYPLADSVAGVQVVRSSFEPRPDNYPANNTVPTSAQLAGVQSLPFLSAEGNRMIHSVTGNFTGTTDEILQWAAIKWGFPADMARANAVIESYWHQANTGDVGHGVSLGILQVKSSDFTGTCPNGWTATSASDPVLQQSGCLSHLITAFDADYKYAYQRACVDGHITYLSQKTPTAGYPKYVNGPGANNSVLGCIGDWFSGSWEDSASIGYQASYTSAFSERAWLQPGF